MAVLRNLGYFFQEALRSTRHSWVMSLASVTIVTISLLLLGIFLLMARNLDSFAGDLETRMEITAYLTDGMSEDIRFQLQRQIESWAEVKEVGFISKDEALLKLQDDLQEDSEILDIVRDNPLPASYEVRVKSGKDIASVAARLERIVWVDDVSYGREIVDKMLALTRMIRYFGWGMVALLGLASLMIIANTIKLTVYARRDEIEIMKLVGATDWFIRWPFLIEGTLQGFFGAVIAILILFVSYQFLIREAEFIFPFLSQQIDAALVGRLSVKLILFGVFLGVVGSFVSVRRFLKG
ncbi:MAG: permease-like cell division protein FtsX [bacterium]|jgi:cell division transport system permease protein|nr:permease-like cell division protein FtsX [bacterium]